MIGPALKTSDKNKNDKNRNKNTIQNAHANVMREREKNNIILDFKYYLTYYTVTHKRSLT
jgi:uncharacterized protein YcaQ